MDIKVAKVVTIIIMATSIAIWICWDIIVAALGLFPATESRILLAFASVNIVFPSALGALLGHLFWPIKGEVKYRLARVWFLAGYISVIFLLNVLRVFPEVVPILPLVLHVPLGHFLWSQEKKAL